MARGVTDVCPSLKMAKPNHLDKFQQQYKLNTWAS